MNGTRIMSLHQPRSASGFGGAIVAGLLWLLFMELPKFL